MKDRSRFQLKEGWSTFFLLWAMLLVASLAIFRTDLIEGLHVVAFAATAGMFAGLVLAKSEFKDRTAHLYAFVYGLFAVAYLIGTILPGDLEWRERIIEIAVRQGEWLQKAIEGGTSRDGLIFVIQTTAVYWILGYTAAWYTYRYPRVWRVVLPTGLVLLSVVYYYNGPNAMVLYLAVYAVLALLYAVRTHFNEEEQHWRASAILYEKGSWMTFIRAGLLISLVVLLLSWSLPAMSANAAVNDALSGTQGPWREFQDNWMRLFSSLRTYGVATSDPYQDNLVLGGPRSVGSTLIMDVVVPRRLRSVYWQAVAYDTYEDGRWQIVDDLESHLHYPDDGLLNIPQMAGRETVSYAIHNYLPNSSLIYSAPDMVATDRLMYIDSTRDERNKDLIISARSRYVLRQGDMYTVMSRVSTADAQSLREAGVSYPEWVTERFLQVPASISAETQALAEQLTSPYDNPFDKSIAVRDYLRANITYNDQIDAPPEGVEPVDYVLFETQEGYCNYYASAMVMMLRSQGIPSRVVSGFAQGDFDEESSSYRVRASNAHTWVEVYFPLYGWIQFEPTASIPTVDRPESSGGGDAFASPVLDPPRLPEELDPQGLIEDDPRGSLDSQLEPIAEPSWWENFPIWQAALAIAILLVAAAMLVFAHRANQRVEGDVDRSYNRLGFWATLLGILFGPADTPYERAERMTVAVPEGREPIRSLTQEYVRKQFSAAYAPDETFDPHQEWRQLRPLLVKESIARYYRRLMGRIQNQQP